MKTVYTCFCTDIIHEGHLNIIREGMKHGKVIAGVLGDEAMIRFNRFPAMEFEERMELIRGIEGVSEVVVQDEIMYDRIIEKLHRRNLPVSLESVVNNLDDVAGIRVICSFIDDIYEVADMLIRQDDVHVIAIKDYLKHPKSNGYRSYHMIIEVPVFFSDRKKPMRVEVQIRTIAMDFWASLDHQLKYKKELVDGTDISSELKDCADVIAQTDEKMLDIRKRIEAQGVVVMD